MSMRSEYYSQLSTEELVRLWNESNNGADARNELRARLGFKRGDHFGRMLADALVAERGGNHPPPPDVVGFGEVSVSVDEVRELKRAATLVGEEPIGRLCQLILDSGWNFVDIRVGRSHIDNLDQDRITDFLEECIANQAWFSSMSQGQQNFFRLIFNAWFPWYKKINHDHDHGGTPHDD